MKMNFCNVCGHSLEQRIPPDDDRERHVCGQCDTVHYLNPRIIAGALVTAGEAILLCRRAIEPRRGLWTLPAGFMENGETTTEAAIRETREEALAEVTGSRLYTIFNLPEIDQVYMFYLAGLKGDGFAAGTESLEVRLFREDEIPWDHLAFPVVRRTLQLFLEDRQRDHFPVRVEDMRWRRP